MIFTHYPCPNSVLFIISPLAALSHQNPNQNKSSSISISSDTQREIDEELKTAEKSTSTDDESIENELSQQQHAQSPKSIKKDNKTKSWRRSSVSMQVSIMKYEFQS
jgi:hypothetical protein